MLVSSRSVSVDLIFSPHLVTAEAAARGGSASGRRTALLPLSATFSISRLRSASLSPASLGSHCLLSTFGDPHSTLALSSPPFCGFFAFSACFASTARLSPAFESVAPFPALCPFLSFCACDVAVSFSWTPFPSSGDSLSSSVSRCLFLSLRSWLFAFTRFAMPQAWMRVPRKRQDPHRKASDSSGELRMKDCQNLVAVWLRASAQKSGRSRERRRTFTVSPERVCKRPGDVVFALHLREPSSLLLLLTAALSATVDFVAKRPFPFSSLQALVRHRRRVSPLRKIGLFTIRPRISHGDPRRASLSRHPELPIALGFVPFSTAAVEPHFPSFLPLEFSAKRFSADGSHCGLSLVAATGVLRRWGLQGSPKKDEAGERLNS
ncbi:hypothetical protein TGRH88_082980 [Toxoplasma gondii]|uniref:Uncharacterized protein n=1 Tax=Toxoplasma gondii TaxID=5811 RepID=A0A7J6K4T7_TOXGO|nr:hypothetical protein TGRH88_082980 [Toxoplasma gondii]